MIFKKQNEVRQLQRLAAQRHLYATAKRIFGWQLFLSGFLTVCFSFLIILDSSFTTIAVSWGILISLADLCVLTPWQNNLRNSAAKIQELFDCEVLDLSWNELKAGSRPDHELVKEEAEKYAKNPLKDSPLDNWYDHPEIDDLPIYIGRIACQRSNCWWDFEQRRSYARYVIGVVVAIFVIVFGISLQNSLEISNFVINVLAPLFPLLLLGVNQYFGQRDAVRRLGELKQHLDSLWIDALSKKTKTFLTVKSRNIQDELLEHRRKTPSVFDFIFSRLRGRYNANMNFGLDEQIKEAKRKGF